MAHREEKIAELVAHTAAEMLNETSDRTSLITVTRATISPGLEKATVFISVLPEDKTNDAIAFANRRRPEMYEKLKRHNLRSVPRVLFLPETHIWRLRPGGEDS